MSLVSVSRSTFLALFVVGVVATRASAEEHEHSARSLVLSADTVLGAAVIGESGKKIDKVKDLVLHVDDGRILGVVLASGAIERWKNLPWEAKEKRFRMQSSRQGHSSNEDQDRSEHFRPRFAAAQLGSKAAGSGSAFTSDSFLCSHLDGLELINTTAKPEGKDNKELASANGVFIDVRSGHVGFLTASIGGVLGIGAESKVIPWKAVNLTRDASGDFILATSFTESRLKQAPNFGDGERELHNPQYRDSVYTFYGVEKPNFDNAAGHAGDAGGLSPLEELIGAEVELSERDGKERRKDSVKDLFLDPKAGNTKLIVLEGGKVLSVDQVTWVREKGCFRASGEKETSTESKHGLVAASSIVGAKVKGPSEKYGSVDKIYVDNRDKELKLITLTVGSTLGFGGEVKALPWSLLRVQTRAGENPELFLPLTQQELRTAPSVDEKAGASLHNPAFRQRVQEFQENKSKD